ncbi:ubiquitin-ribosomal protein eL40 fusion protein-like [Genypterus blacodes]|uniref:ubiquitin-ribosomal protein eL40 fusion protein-like n=1 Tax=Genypterus blacodes TaxID=154954 RepID=UPI003F76CDDE
MGKIYQVMVNGFRGEKMTIDLCNTEEQMASMTVLQLKEKIVERLPGKADPDTLRLLFTDKTLEGDATLLSSYGIQHNSIIHMVLRVAGGLEL